MPNIASLLKEEITRVARREVRKELASIKRASAQYRKDIARLKRELAAYKQELATLRKQRKPEAAAAVMPGDTEGRRFSPKGLQAHRKRLGLSARELGQLLGVSGQRIYMWESGKARPRKRHFAAIVALRHLGKREARARLGAKPGARRRPARSQARPIDTELRARLEQLLRTHRGNVTAVANEMGKARAQVHRWIVRFGIDRRAFVPAAPARAAVAPELRQTLLAQLRNHEGNVRAVSRDMGKAPAQIYRWLRRFEIDPADYR